MGRNDLVNDFEMRIDDFDKPPINTLIVSGLPNIGRKSLARHCLIKGTIIPQYYEFSQISLSYQESIEDFIVKIHDLGFTAGIELPKISTKTMEEKIDCAVSLSKDLAALSEIVLIKDDGCLVDYRGNISEWFKSIITSTDLQEQMLFVIITKYKINFESVRNICSAYTSLDEQIKKQKNSEYDHKRFAEDEVKQRALLDRLQKIVEGKAEYAYLVNPIISLAVDLDKSISFNKYLIQETTTRELKKQRDRIRQQILANKSRFAIYSVSEKEQAVTLIKEYLSYYDCDFDGGSLSEIRRELRKVREEIRILQNGNDTEKINSLSADITQLYKSSIEVSELAEYDFRKSGFHISYLKNGNILQPQILDEESDSADQIKNYYTGSMARHTLMQLCGYLGFLRMLIKEDKYPLIPFLVIDHISKPFDNKNQKALGAILHGAYTNLQKSEMQIILFDDEDASSLGLTPDHSINLLGEDKSGFNPFYMTSKEDSPNAPEEVE